MKKFYFFFFLLSFGVLRGQTDITVNFTDSSWQVFSVLDSGKLFFDDTSMYISTDGLNTTSIPINVIQSVTAQQQGLILPEQNFTDNFLLHPNPVDSDIRIISKLEDSFTVKIYNVQGQLVLQGPYSSNDVITVAYLSSGLYFVKVNDVLLKFIKK